MMVDRGRGARIRFALAAGIPFSLLRVLTRAKLLIPYYHVVSDEDIRHVKHLYRYKTIRQFREDMDFLLKEYSPISLDELVTYRRNGRALPKRAFLLTFDDGYREISDIIAPILLEKGVSATFFVNSAFIDNKELCYLNKASLIVEHLQKRGSWAMAEGLAGILPANQASFASVESGILSLGYRQRHLLDAMANVAGVDFGEYLSIERPYVTSDQINGLIERGFTIGAHSIDHPAYASLSLREQLDQTIESVRHVREMFRLDYGVFAFPFSDDGISGEFFAMLANEGLIDLSFGTAGLVEDEVPNHFQRVSLEKPVEAASRIVAFQHARRLKRLITGYTRVVRT